MAKQVVELTGDEAALLRSYNNAVQKQAEFEAKLRAGGQAGDAAGTQIEDALAKVKRASDQALRSLLGDLKSMGTEGAASADAVKVHLQETGKAGYRSIETILDQIRQIDPEAAEAANAARASLGAAAQTTEHQFRAVLEEIRASGPEGRKAAKEIETAFLAAGKLSRRSVADIATGFAHIDEEAAEIASKIISHTKEGTDGADNVFKSFSESAVQKIGAVATAYLGFGEMVQMVNQYLEIQRERMASISETQMEVAQAQEDATKNMVGLDKAERIGLLEASNPLAQEIKMDPKFVTEAIGSVVSMGVDNPEKVKEIIRTAAATTRLHPEKLAAIAGGTADIMNKTGIDDSRKATALFVSAQTESQVEQADKARDTLPRALATGVATAPKQAPEEAASETGAIWAAATMAGSDKEGRSSTTFVGKLQQREAAFFGDLEQEQIKARSEVDLLNRKVESGTATELDRTKLAEANAFLDESWGMSDPGTHFKRMQVLRDNPAMLQRFMGPEGGFGEEQFRTFLNQLFDPNGEAAKSLKAKSARIRPDVAVYDNLADELRTATPQMRSAVFVKESEAIRKATEAMLTNEGNAGEITKATKEAIKNSYAPGLEGSFQWLSDFSGWSSLSGSSTDNAALSVQRLQQQIARLQADGVTTDEANKIAGLKQQMESVFNLVGSGDVPAEDARRTLAAVQSRSAGLQQDELRRSGTITPEGQEMLNVFKRLEAILSKIAQDSGETARNTGKTPALTPALGAVRP